MHEVDQHSAIDWDKFQYVERKEVQATPCLELQLYSDADRQVVTPALLLLYQNVLALLGNSFTFYRLNDQSKWQKMKPGDQNLLSSWLTQTDFDPNQQYGIDFHSGATQRDMHAPALEFFYSGLSQTEWAIRIVFPVTDAAQWKATLFPLLQQTFTQFPFRWGSAGYSIYWNTCGDFFRIGKWLRPHLKRHPGFSHGNLISEMKWIPRGLPTIGWLTLIGSEYLQTLGGLAALEKAATGTDLQVSPLAQEAAIVQAGELPEIGDVNRGENLPAYHQAGQLLAAVRVPDADLDELLRIHGFAKEEAVEWCLRFFPH